jgi:CHAT domain-containing protein
LNDLAVAYDASARLNHRPFEFRNALAAVTAALRIDNRSTEALFNRALFLEHLGLRPLALDAWNRYLATNESGQWAVEASEHRRAIIAATPPDFRVAFRAASGGAATGDVKALETLVVTHPQDARLWTQGPVLLEWAETFLNGPGTPERSLAIARTIGRRLAERGDHGVEQSVAAIDGANGAQKRRLAQAHILYGRGRKAYAAGLLTEAGRLLTQAASSFDEAHSPMANVCRYFIGCVTFDAGHIDAAADRLYEALRHTDLTKYPALAAEIRWQLGLCFFARSRYGAAAASLATSAAAFDRLGETMNAAVTREIRAEVLELVGQTTDAWIDRPSILAALSTNDFRLRSALAHLAMAAMSEREWHLADALLDLEIDGLERSTDPQLVANAWTRRAVVSLRLGDRARAVTAIAAARRIIGSMPDMAMRKRAEADLAGVEALVAPGQSVAALSASIDYHRREGRQIYVPALLLERSRVWKIGGNAVRESTDLDEAISGLEAGHAHSPNETASDIDFDVADEVFEAAIENALAAGDDDAAFELSERARAIAFFGLPAARLANDISAAIHPTEALLEFVALRDKLVIFTVRPGGVAAYCTSIERTRLEMEVEALRESIDRHAPAAEIERRSSEMYGRLIAPVLSDAASLTALTIIPGFPLDRLPFAALYDRGSRSYLIEKHRLVLAPSAATWLRARRQQQTATATPPHALLVANPRQTTSTPLPEAIAEARAVARYYRAPVVLTDAAATTAAFAEHARRASVIHFAGHGIGDAASGTALLLADRHGEQQILDASDIASMRLNNTRVAVLAACNSAVGERRGHERTISVSRAFLAAGVPSVIGALWNLPDRESVFLFTRLHCAIARGAAPADALREAQLACIHARDPSISAPAIWAPVQVLGN